MWSSRYTIGLWEKEVMTQKQFYIAIAGILTCGLLSIDLTKISYKIKIIEKYNSYRVKEEILENELLPAGTVDDILTVLPALNGEIKTESNNKKNNKSKDKKEILSNEDIILQNKDIGIIEIPSINCKSTIVDGISKNELKTAVGHFPDTSMPGKTGNCAIAGHSSQVFTGQVFNDLDKTNIGDVIYIYTKDTGYVAYIIYLKEIIEPTQTEVIDQTVEPILTIITCAEQGKKRLMVRANLVNKERINYE